MLCVLKDGGFAVIVILECPTKTVFVQCRKYIITEVSDCFGLIKFKLRGVEEIAENNGVTLNGMLWEALLSTITQSRAQSLLMAANLKANKLRITKGH